MRECDELDALIRESDRFDMMSKFAAAVHLVFSGKTDAVDTMRSDFKERIARMFRGEREPVGQTLADKYGGQWLADQDAFMEIEKTARFVTVKEPNVVS